MDKSSGITNSSISDETSLNSSLWLLADDIVGPVVAAFVGMEFFLAVSLNSFIIIHTLYTAKKKLNSSSFLLFMLSLMNLLMGLLYLPYWAVAVGSGEWIFGNTDSIRNILCKMHGFLVIYLTVASIHILAVISIDRCLSIIKPHTHKRYMTWKMSLLIIVVLMIIDSLVSMAPFYTPTLGKYSWSPRVGACLALLVGYRVYTILQSLHSLIPLAIIIITSAWTFVFTSGFLMKTLKIQRAMLDTQSYEHQKHIYTVKVLNLFGIFGTLILFNIISWIPYLLTSVIGSIGLGYEIIPNKAYAAGFVLFCASNVFNPLIQVYFRKELALSIKNVFCWFCSKHNSISEPRIVIRKNSSVFGASRTMTLDAKVERMEKKVIDKSSVSNNTVQESCDKIQELYTLEMKKTNV